jgi:hypothetical protein
MIIRGSQQMMVLVGQSTILLLWMLSCFHVRLGTAFIPRTQKIHPGSSDGVALLVDTTMHTSVILKSSPTDVHGHASYVQYTSNPPLEKSGGVLYRQSILTNEEYSAIQKEVLSLMTQLNDETTSSVAQNRLGASLSQDSESVRILQEGSLCKFVQRMTGDSTMVLSSNLPVEVRVYEKFGAAMAWHEDDVLYDPPQVEAVVTLENNSDCVTMWKNGEQVETQETDPNSVVLFKAGGPLHCVTSLKRGRRVILKVAYASSEASFREGIHKDQFGASKKKGKKKRSKR